MCILQVSENHTCSNNKEKDRIIRNKGFIKKHDADIHERIYLHEQLVPAAHFTRSIGDLFAHSIGVISKPNIVYFNDIKMFRKIIIANNVFWDAYEDRKEVFQILFNANDT